MWSWCERECGCDNRLHGLHARTCAHTRYLCSAANVSSARNLCKHDATHEYIYFFLYFRCVCVGLISLEKSTMLIDYFVFRLRLLLLLLFGSSGKCDSGCMTSDTCTLYAEFRTATERVRNGDGMGREKCWVKKNTKLYTHCTEYTKCLSVRGALFSRSGKHLFVFYADYAVEMTILSEQEYMQIHVENGKLRFITILWNYYYVLHFHIIFSSTL